MKDKIIEQFFRHPSEVVISEMINQNIVHVRRIAKIVTVIESVILLMLIMSTRKLGNVSSTRSMLQVSFCIITSFAVAALLKGEDTENYRDLSARMRIKILMSIYLIALTGWGMIVSQAHFVIGDQILTFYIVEIMILCFVIMPPIVSLFTTIGSFSVFYLFLSRTVEAGAMEQLNTTNYFAMALLCWIGAMARFHQQCNESEKMEETRKLNVRLNLLSEQDGLTGLGNRIALRNYFSECMGRPMAVMMADVDDFKKINDDFSHTVGDQVLTALADSLRSAWPYGHIFRYGGDEFLVIQESVSQREFLSQRGSWLDTVDLIEIEDMDRPLVVSNGFVMGAPATGDDLRDMIHAADMALYEMKENKKPLKRAQ